MPDVLVLDTATPAVTAALVRVAADRVEPLSVQVRADARRHGELLAPAVRAALAGAGRTVGDLDAVVAGLGPGPFTGLRVGLVTAAAIADALRIPAYGVCSLDGLAVAPGRLLVATDARRREVYWAVYDDGARVLGPEVDRPAELAARDLGVTAAAGAGARMYADVLRLPLTGPDSPDPVALAARAAGSVLSGAPGDPLTPLYLRRPDAVEPGRPKAVTPA
ncbi:MAG TPA: tRNA (adenosine(37)-N6)-threonylcarbamoyltransferase complex dimerization subunit type 1 TsaB [Mycobacteriales bacterium]